LASANRKVLNSHSHPQRKQPSICLHTGLSATVATTANIKSNPLQGVESKYILQNRGDSTGAKAFSSRQFKPSFFIFSESTAVSKCSRNLGEPFAKTPATVIPLSTKGEKDSCFVRL